MSAEELPRELLPQQQAWTVASISRDGTRLLLVDGDGNEMSVAVAPDVLPRRSEKTMDQGMTPSLRPRDIQARIRAGESPESVAEAAGTTLERIMPFAAPVVAEREHMAERAQKATVRRLASESTARTLGDAVALQLAGTDPTGGALGSADVTDVDWDSWRRADGRWALAAVYTTPNRSGTAEFTFDPPGNVVSLDNDDARWLVGDLPPAATPEPVVDDLAVARVRRLEWTDSAPVETSRWAGNPDGSVDAAATPAVNLPSAPKPTWTPEAAQLEIPVEGLHADPEEVAPHDTRHDGAHDGAETPARADDAEKSPAPKRPKRRGRASVPSWDEIMFGGGSGPDAD